MGSAQSAEQADAETGTGSGAAEAGHETSDAEEDGQVADPSGSEQVAQQDELGRLHFKAAIAHFETGDYEQAAREFELAYEISKRPALLYDLALCHERLAQLEPAIKALDAYLEQTTTLQVDERAKLEARLANLRSRWTAQRHEREQRGEATGATASRTEAPEGSPPLYRNKWLWTAVGVVVVGVGVGLAAGLGKGGSSLPDPVTTENSLPNVELRAAVRP